MDKNSIMDNPAYMISKTFEGAEFQDRLVAFIDIMGIKQRMKKATTPQDMRLFSQLLYMYAHHPFAKEKVDAIVFSDCMYLIAEARHLDKLTCLLSNFCFNHLVNRETKKFQNQMVILMRELLGIASNFEVESLMGRSWFWIEKRKERNFC